MPRLVRSLIPVALLLSGQLSVAARATPVPTPAPAPVDLAIRAIGQPVVGRGIINETGRHQEAIDSLKPGSTTAFDVVLTNPTPTRLTYSLAGAGSGATFTIEYWGPEGDITSDVTAGTYERAVPGGSRERFRIIVSADALAETGQHRSFWIDAAPTDGGVTDRVLATVQVPPIRSWA